MQQWLAFAFVGLLLCSAGCPSSTSDNGRASTPGSPGPSPDKPRICRLDMAAVFSAARETPAMKALMEKIRALKTEAQRRVDLLVSGYQSKFRLDIAGAAHLKKVTELGRLRGSAISEETYQERLKALDDKLKADPDLKRVVDEIRSRSEAYKLRYQKALAEAKRIAADGRRLQKELARKADEISAPMARAIQKALRDSVKSSTKANGCTVLCDPSKGRRIGIISKAKVERGSEDACRKGMTEGKDISPVVRDEVLRAIQQQQ